jgi:hypothetical protein
MEEVEPGTAQGMGRQKPGGTIEQDTHMGGSSNGRTRSRASMFDLRQRTYE